ncbi:MAG: type II secretion system protein, partial [Patescibacteria group bacterium]|nr:type II secretion system protein [Patescibacteria group bacterium]
MKLTRGFTLVEILVYVSILAITAGLLTAVLTNTVRVRTRAANSTELAQQLNFVLGTVQSLVNESANVEGVYEGADSGVACSEFCTLNLRMTAT